MPLVGAGCPQVFPTSGFKLSFCQTCKDLAWLEECKHNTQDVLRGSIGREGTFCISVSSSLNHITHAWKMAFTGHVLGIVPPCTALLVFLLRLMRLSCVLVSLTGDVLEAGRKNAEEQEDLTGYQGLQGTGTESWQKDTGK